MRKNGFCSVALAAALLLGVGSVGAQDDLNQKVQAGWQALQQGNLKDARAAFQDVIDASPVYDFGWYALGQVAAREGKTDEAIGHFSKATELKPDKFEYHYGLAGAYATKEDYPKAIATLNNADNLATEKQNQFYLHRERGQYYYSIRQYDRAVEDLRKAVQLQPSDPRAQQRLGMAYYRGDDYKSALDHLKLAAAKNSRDYTTQIYLARAAVALGQQTTEKERSRAIYADAVKAAQSANSLKSGFEAQNLLAKAYLGAGQFEQAARTFNSVLQSKPNYCAAMVNLGQSYIGTQSWPQATQVLAKASECDPKSTLTLNLLAFAYLKDEKRQEALDTYQKSYGMKADPKVAEHIKLVQENIRIAQENEQIDQFNADQRAALDAEKAEYERKMREFEEQQKKIQEYKEKDE